MYICDKPINTGDNCSSWSKDTAATLNYTFDWRDWLRSSNIATAVITLSGIDTELLIENQSFDDKSATVLLSNGTPRMVYTITCNITTDSGLSESVERILIINV